MQAASNYFDHWPVQQTIHTASEIQAAINSRQSKGVTALFVCSDSLTHENSDNLNGWAKGAGM